MNATPPVAPPPDRLAWPRRLNATLSAWAATLSWWRMILLGLIALIAGSWISESLQLSHHVTRQVVKSRVVKPGDASGGTDKPCKDKRIVIGGQQAIVITEAGCKPATPASGSKEPLIKIEVPPAIGPEAGSGDDTEEKTSVIRTPIRELIGQLDPQQFWQIHRASIVNLSAVAAVQRDDSGRQHVTFKQHPEVLEVSRSFSHLFRAA
jgi:hypothetical protein